MLGLSAWGVSRRDCHTSIYSFDPTSLSVQQCHPSSLPHLDMLYACMSPLFDTSTIPFQAPRHVTDAESVPETSVFTAHAPLQFNLAVPKIAIAAESESAGMRANT